jgi:hypothetical protein
VQIQVEMQVSNLLLTAQIRHNLPGSGIWPDERDTWGKSPISRECQSLRKHLAMQAETYSISAAHGYFHPDSFVVMSTTFPESKVSPDLFGGVGDAIRGDEAG